MENGSRIPEYRSDSETIVIKRAGSTMNVLSLRVGANADLWRLSCRTFPHPIDPTTGQQPNIGCESGTYHKFLLASVARSSEPDVGMILTFLALITTTE